MPPKVKVTKEMVLNAAFEITRADGIEAVNAKNVAAYLKCSTQPVMYNFATIEELKLAVFDKAFEYMKKRVVFPKGKKSEYPMREVGLDYIAFARSEPNIFRLLARADWAFSPSSKVDLIVQKAIIDKQYDIMQLNVTLFKYTNEILGV